jgi:prepilin-type N-terminal cleavage/methylation domain-containing protein
MCNDKGFTLVETMVAILILVVAMLGLLKSLEVATAQTIQTQLRDTALRIATDRMNRFKSVTFDQLSTCNNSSCSGGLHTYAQETAQVKMRGATKTFTITRTTAVTSAAATAVSAADLGVRVTWTYGNKSMNYELHSVKSE